MRLFAGMAVLLAAVVALPGQCLAFFQEPVAMQISSTVSDGKDSLRDIVATVRKSGIKVVILTERDLMKWEYGLWPLRNLIKKTVEGRSLLKYGAARYLRDVGQVQAENPDMLIIPGVESAPYYYWAGNPFSGGFTITDWHRHILSFGFSSARDYERLPVIGNFRGLSLPFHVAAVLPFILCLLSACLVLGRFPVVIRALGVAAFIIGILMIMNGFCVGQKFDQYCGDLGIRPYQDYVDYTRSRGALTFWAHPEAENSGRDGVVSIATRDYSDLLARVDAYTGFCVFYEGYAKVGVPGGIWDRTLVDYCNGRRSYPVWAAAGLAVDAGGGLEANLRDVRTVVMTAAFTQEAVLEAMRSGKMYAVRGAGAPDFVLDDFSLCDGKVVLKGRSLRGQTESFQIQLIRNSKVIAVLEQSGSGFDLRYPHDVSAGESGYYRAEIRSSSVQAITNPVFYGVRKRQPKERK